MSYKVCDIFYSVQGEGYFTGRPAVFIRMFGCNLNCSFCDEPLHKTRYQGFDTKKLLATVNKHKCDFVVITGGEPSINDLNKLIVELKELGKYVAIETNGYKFQNIEEADWITYSPKDMNSIHANCWDEIKFVVGDDFDEEILHNIPDNKLIWLQPMADGDQIIQDNVDRCIQIIKKNPHIRLSLQTHKLIGIK